MTQLLMTQSTEAFASRRRQYDERERCLDGSLVAGDEQEKAQWDAEEGGREQPAGAAYMNLPPILCYDHGGNRNGKQNRKRRGDPDRNDEREQRHGNQRFAKAEGGADQSCERRPAGRAALLYPPNSLSPTSPLLRSYRRPTACLTHLYI